MFAEEIGGSVFTRRTWLGGCRGGLDWGVVAVGLGGCGAAGNVRAKAKSVILIFNCGAPSHIDLWDPKPEAPR